MTERKRTSYPKSLKKHRLSWVYKKIWAKAHNKNQMFSVVTCGPPGSGKSWLDLSMAETLDRSGADIDRFTIDRVYFSAGEFAKGMAKDYPVGTVHIFDDVGLHLFSREAMLKTVRDIAKIFQSIRYKNYILLLSLPAFGMLDKVVRQLIDVYIQPVGIDYELCRNEVKFQWLQTEPMMGKIFRHKLEMSAGIVHPLLNYTTLERFKFNTIWVDKPSDKLVKAYEEKKKKFMDEYYQKSAREIVAREEGKLRTSQSRYERFYKIVKENKDNYWREGKEGTLIDTARIIAAHPECGTYTATMIARVINAEISIRQKNNI